MESSATTCNVSSALMPDDPSFPSYLKPNEPSRASQERLRAAGDQDAEISIFDARKYFSETNDHNQRTVMGKRVSPVTNVNNHICDLSTVPRFSSASSMEAYGTNHRTRSFHVTPTASSEASWNSQTGLLSNPPDAISVSLKNLPTDHKDKKKSSGYTLRWLFGRKCPCKDKKSVQVEEKAVSKPRKTTEHLNSKPKKVVAMNSQMLRPKSEGSNQEGSANKPEGSFVNLANEWEAKLKHDTVLSSHRISTENRFPPNFNLGPRVLSARPLSTETAAFTFPILNTAFSPTLAKEQTTDTFPASTNTFKIPPSEDSRRNSLEIYQPPDELISRRSSPEIQNRILLPLRGRSSFINNEDDLASDASSDLFEIESLSTQTTSYQVYQFRRDSLDEGRRLPSRTHSMDDPLAECYPPSEVSIDWSMTTVETFDQTGGKHCSGMDDPITTGQEGGSKRRGNGLLSCRCEKAVSVGPQPGKYVEKGAENLIGRHVNSRAGMANKPPLMRSHSARLSLPFAA